MRPLLPILVAILLPLTLAACGQKGALKLPPDAPTPAPAPAAKTPPVEPAK